MLRRIKVYGRLRKFLGGQSVFEADVANPAEAISFLIANWPKLEVHMAKQYYKVFVGNHNVGKDELHDPSSVQEEIKIIPVVFGAAKKKKGGFLSSPWGIIIIGALLIAAPYAIPALAGSGVLATAVAKAMTSIGIGLVLTGVSELLNPTPQDKVDDQEPQESYSFSGIQNVSRVVPVPICYGETMVGSVIVSAGIDTVQLKGTT